MTRTMKITIGAAVAVIVFGMGFAIAAAAPWHRTGYEGGPRMYGGMMGNTSGMMTGGMMTGAHMGPMMGGGWTGGGESAPSAVEGAREVTVTLDNFKFSPSTITLKAGEAVNVVVKNTDEIVHDFTVPALNTHVTVQPGQQATVGLQPSTAGTYPFLCTVAGHAQAGMHGTIVVRS